MLCDGEAVRTKGLTGLEVDSRTRKAESGGFGEPLGQANPAQVYSTEGLSPASPEVWAPPGPVPKDVARGQSDMGGQKAKCRTAAPGLVGIDRGTLE